MKQVELYNNHRIIGQALVDDSDYETVSKYKWGTGKRSYNYPTARIDGKTISMHVFIMGKINDMEIDHINRNRRDNRRCNLRFCTRSENQCNKTMRSKSGLRGVFALENGFRASIRLDGKVIQIGRFKTAEEAAMAYDNIAKKRDGKYAILNYPGL